MFGSAGGVMVTSVLLDSMVAPGLGAGAAGSVMIVVVDSTGGVFVTVIEVSAVLDALTPVSLGAAVPIVSSVLLLQPTSATKSAAVNKLFFIIIFLIVR